MGDSPCPTQGLISYLRFILAALSPQRGHFALGTRAGVELSMLCPHPTRLKDKAEATVPMTLDTGLGYSGTANSCFLNL